MSSVKNVTGASATFFDAVESRRTFYNLSSESTIPDSHVTQIVQDAVKHAPSAFNSQTGRAVVLFDDHHKKLWDIVLDSTVPHRSDSAGTAAIAARILGFQAGHGTVLYFEDDDVIKAMQQRAPAYKEEFPKWAAHSSGMIQFIVWTALEKEGLGASLQHFNLVEQAVQKELALPASWKLISQMPFGTPTAQPGEKQFSPIEDRVKVFA